MSETIRLEEGAKRVRAFLGGVPAADTTRPVLVWEKPYCPTYYFPAADVPATLTPTGETRDGAVVHDVTVGGTTARNAALTRPEPELRDLVRLEWDAFDEWFEEDQPVYVHPRDPYVRVDALPSSRHVRVVIDGVVIAESRRPVVLFETGLPPRYYLPLADVRQEVLRPTATTTSCPYKGTASYWSAVLDGRVHEDVAWGYRTPLPESAPIAGLVAFYGGRVELHVDGRRVFN
ncbi:DUF427 domain-containing protein [Saccharothrix violaceirubra]|uniref:Uncharacterized protein (DUF427 family) n=1 Tax=Saccharothrix violaceirubra TaxID=413306 RepID=A0A7W7T5Z8_9PSEU|nr:DUF427 domain-containing protein [Saccharothrix violaceirubra]MBB4967207.1 uncharacterized protein (DUF427 family) [Saccharothrix violaceirubra]